MQNAKLEFSGQSSFTYFSCFGKISARRRNASEQPPAGRHLASRKSTKRSRHRGGADRRSLSKHHISSNLLPRLRADLHWYDCHRQSLLFLIRCALQHPPLCTSPGAGRKNGSRRSSLNRDCSANNTHAVIDRKIDLSRSFDGGRVGARGRAAQRRAENAGFIGQ